MCCIHAMHMDIHITLVHFTFTYCLTIMFFNYRPAHCVACCIYKTHVQ